MKILKDKIFLNLPPENRSKTPEINSFKAKSIIIIDDDPTGCQTLHGVELLFSWDIELLSEKLDKKIPVLFILANTRSMDNKLARSTVKEICCNLKIAGQNTGQEFIIISRSDSTLRGHYPDEPDVIAEVLELENPVHCLIPVFFQGGRFTIEDVHYVEEGEYLIPASETPFAKDKSFGFHSSNLYDYIIEKTGNKIQREEITSISISEIRNHSLDEIEAKLSKLSFKACFVNAAAQSDLDVFSQAAAGAIRGGRKIVFRTAASFLNSIAGIPQKELLKRKDVKNDSPTGALFIVGSYVPKSSAQLERLLNEQPFKQYEINIENLARGKADDYKSLSNEISNDLDSGRDVVLFTQRKLISGNSIQRNLEIGRKVSDFLVKTVKAVTSVPSFILTKGGITSHVIAKDALEIKEAMVLGQILPGVPVIKSKKGKFRNTPFIIFPGNVGNDDSLCKILKELKKSNV